MIKTALFNYVYDLVASRNYSITINEDGEQILEKLYGLLKSEMRLKKKFSRSI